MVVVVEVVKLLIVTVTFPLPGGRCKRKGGTKGETSCAASSRDRSSVDTSSRQVRWRVDMVKIGGKRCGGRGGRGRGGAKRMLSGDGGGREKKQRKFGHWPGAL